MLGWLKGVSENLAAVNMKKVMGELVQAATVADARICRTGDSTPAEKAEVVRLQKRLLFELSGPVPLHRAWDQFFHPVLADPGVCDGAKLAVLHVFQTAEQQRR